MSTRSEQLFVVQLDVQQDQLVYTCPPSSRVILKSLNWTNTSAARAGTLFVYLVASGVLISLVRDDQSSTWLPYRWDGWVVLRPGDEVVASPVVGSYHLLGSGAILPAPS